MEMVHLVTVIVLNPMNGRQCKSYKVPELGTLTFLVAVFNFEIYILN